MPFFVRRLITPRPIFASDLSGAGRALLARRPRGSGGRAVFDAADEAKVGQIAGDEPVLSAGMDFSNEIFPMTQAVSGRRLLPANPS